ncbi:TRAP transporter substrate-binding protein [Clostridium sp.]|uniref:TRAP transporter substrate-binding protein n=1 Tax=Clostridium sp. TaxID=1506 RepID=UPI0039954BCB
MVKKTLLVLMVTTLLGSTLGGCSTGTKTANGKNVELLRVAHNQGENHPIHKALLEFEKEVEKNSNAEIDVQVFPNEILGSQREAVELTQTGAIDISVASISLLESFEEMYSVFNVPYLFDSKEHYYSVMNDEEILGPLFEQTRNDGFVGLTWYDAGTRNIYTNKKSIEKPEDLKGMKIRVQQSPTNIKMIELLGASPTPMGFGEVYTALQQNVIDGAENNEMALITNKHGEVSKYYSYNEHAMIPDILIMNAKKLDGMSEEHRNIVLDAVNKSNEFEVEEWKKSIEEAKKEAEKMGVKFTYPDTKPFQEKVMPIHEEFKKNEKVAPIYNKIREKVEK